MEEINKIVGKNLLDLRKAKKLTQLELAEQFNYSDKSISKWESGDSLPSIDVLYNLASFYGVTIDYLTTTEHSNKNTLTKTKPPRMFPAHLIITLMSASAVWLLATVVFITLLIVANIAYPLVFIWSIPATSIVLIIFNAIWGRTRYLFPLLTILSWISLLGLHLQLLQFNINIWPIYLIGIPLQVGIILWGALVKKTPAYNKELKEKRKLEKQNKKIQQNEQK